MRLILEDFRFNLRVIVFVTIFLYKKQRSTSVFSFVY